MDSYINLLGKKAELDRLLAEAKAREAPNALARIKAAITEYGFTIEDIYGASKRRKAKPRALPVGPIPPKYLDPVSGNTWTGRGTPPQWIRGKDFSQYSILVQQ